MATKLKKYVVQFKGRSGRVVATVPIRAMNKQRAIAAVDRMMLTTLIVPQWTTAGLIPLNSGYEKVGAFRKVSRTEMRRLDKVQNYEWMEV